MPLEWWGPLDPGCPVAEAFYEMLGELGEFETGWERDHRIWCRRCLEHACANIEVY